MQTAAVIEIQDPNQQKILHAAFKRFQHYGYNKTTMAEIAADSGMSAANLYRYFENKQEIASSCVEGCIIKRLDYIRQSIQKNNLNASDRLRILTLSTLRSCHETYSKDTRINELIIFITNEKSEIVHNKIRLVQEEIRSILDRGNQTGEFEVEDIVTTARSIYSSIALFDTPVFIGFYSLEKYEELANEVVDLILNALHKH